MRYTLQFFVLLLVTYSLRNTQEQNPDLFNEQAEDLPELISNLEDQISNQPSDQKSCTTPQPEPTLSKLNNPINNSQPAPSQKLIKNPRLSEKLTEIYNAANNLIINNPQSTTLLILSIIIIIQQLTLQRNIEQIHELQHEIMEGIQTIKNLQSPLIDPI
jgi:hypothetical protein